MEIKAALHAGWKGIFLGIIENAVKIFNKEFCVRPEEIKVYEPHICSLCYEVGREMESKFNIPLNNNKLDLSEIIYNKLKTAGIDKIYNIKRCTFHEDDSFFSYRRNKCTERIISVII
jgi:copper oxidase (laccase) domain-containing protein